MRRLPLPVDDDVDDPKIAAARFPSAVLKGLAAATLSSRTTRNGDTRHA
jgi:hypothetical protein